MSRMGLRKYSRHRGCALSAVQKAILTGRITKGEDGLIDSELADAAWAAHTDQAKQRKEAPPAPAPVDPPLLTGEVMPAPGELARRSQFWGPDWPEPAPRPEHGPSAAVGGKVVEGPEFQEWRARRERAMALREEAKQAAEARLLLNAGEVRRTFYGIGRMFKQARETVADQVAPQLVGLTDLREIAKLVRQVLRETDTRVADEIEARYADMVHDGERSGTGQ